MSIREGDFFLSSKIPKPVKSGLSMSVEKLSRNRLWRSNNVNDEEQKPYKKFNSVFRPNTPCEFGSRQNKKAHFEDQPTGILLNGTVNNPSGLESFAKNRLSNDTENFCSKDICMDQRTEPCSSSLGVATGARSWHRLHANGLMFQKDSAEDLSRRHDLVQSSFNPTHRRTFEDIDNMIAKYTKGFTHEQQKSVLHQDSTEKDSDFRTMDGCVTPALQRLYSPIKDNNADFYDHTSPSHNQPKMPMHKLKTSAEDRTYPLSKRPGSFRKSSHSFPFKETSTGQLIISPEQIAFESKKISVLVADPRIKSIDISTKQDANLNFTDKSAYLEHDELELEALGKFFEVIRSTSTTCTREKISERFEREKGSSASYKYSHATRGSLELQDALHKFIRNAINADTHVEIGSRIFPCHFIAIQAYSQRFQRHGRGRMGLTKIKISESDMPAKSFPPLMDWILQPNDEKISVIQANNVVGLFAAAKYLEIPGLQKQCIGFIKHHVEMKDSQLVELWAEVKKRGSCFELMDVLATKAAKSFNDIYISRQFIHLDIEELTMLLSSDAIAIHSELEVCNAAIEWLLHDWSNRKQYVTRIMKSVRFGLLTPLQLTQIGHYPDVKEDKTKKMVSEVLHHPEVKNYMDQGLKYAILRKSYDTEEELEKWVKSTNITAPRPRLNMPPQEQPIQGNTDASVWDGDTPGADGSQCLFAPRLLNSSRTTSYTIINSKAASINSATFCDYIDSGVTEVDDAKQDNEDDDVNKHLDDIGSRVTSFHKNHASDLSIEENESIRAIGFEREDDSDDEDDEEDMQQQSIFRLQYRSKEDSDPS